jgi:hypothetical protein
MECERFHKKMELRQKQSFIHFTREERSSNEEIPVQNEVRAGVLKHLRCKRNILHMFSFLV